MSPRCRHNFPLSTPKDLVVSSGRSFFTVLGLILLAFGSIGCPPPKPSRPLPPPLSREQAIDAYNQNVYAIPPFSAQISQWQARFIDRDGNLKTQKELGGKIYYHPSDDLYAPVQFYLRANAPFKEALVVGSNNEEFWMYSKWGQSGAWGRYRHLGQPCAQNISIHPQLLREFLGFYPISDQADQPPYLLYKFDDQHLIIQYLRVSEAGLRIEREILLDRYSSLPVEINAYDSQGRQLIHSKLQDYQPLGDAMLPADILLAWPPEDAYLRLQLDNFRIDDQKDRTALFTRPQRISDIEDYQQIDRQCENE